MLKFLSEGLPMDQVVAAIFYIFIIGLFSTIATLPTWLLWLALHQQWPSTIAAVNLKALVLSALIALLVLWVTGLDATPSILDLLGYFMLLTSGAALAALAGLTLYQRSNR
jgi:hypothetical protein